MLDIGVELSIDIFLRQRQVFKGLHMIAYPCHARRAQETDAPPRPASRRGTPGCGTAAAPPPQPSVTALIWFRKAEDTTVPGAGCGVSRATAYRYATEGITHGLGRQPTRPTRRPCSCSVVCAPQGDASWPDAANPAPQHRQPSPSRRYRRRSGSPRPPGIPLPGRFLLRSRQCAHWHHRQAPEQTVCAARRTPRCCTVAGGRHGPYWEWRCSTAKAGVHPAKSASHR